MKEYPKMLAFRFTEKGSKWLSEFAGKMDVSVSEAIRLGSNCLLKEKELQEAQERDSGEDVEFNNEQERLITGLVLVPNVPDSQGHIVSAEEIGNAAFFYMEHYRYTNVMHRNVDGQAFPMESGILSPDDSAWKKSYKKEFSILESYIAPTTFSLGEEEVPEGSWVLTLRVNDDEIWGKILRKELTGFSIGGHAHLEEME